MFNSPNTAAMMGTVPPNRRGIAAGARMMLQNTGAVLSIAFVLAIITAAVPKDVLFEIFSGLAIGPLRRAAAPFIHNMHIALWVLAATSLVGAGVSLLRPRRGTARHGAREASVVRRRERERPRGGRCASARSRSCTGTTPRTIRYYEEIGLLAAPASASAGSHRLYDEADVERLREVLRLKRLLGLSLEELRELVAAEERPRRAARASGTAASRIRCAGARSSRRRLHYIERQLELMRRRRDELDALEQELVAQRRRVR